MKKSIFNRLSTGAIALTLIFAQVILPAHAAFAAKAPGNNGTVKINDEDADTDPGVGNEPHLTTCSVNIRWYGYDAGERASTVTFTAQSPTVNQLVSPIGAQNANFVAPAPVDGNTLSAEKNYNLSFSGTPATEGYHVKATVYTDGSKGNNTKSKVFWLPASCGPQTVVTPDFSLTGVCGINNDTVATITTSDDYTAGPVVLSMSKASITFTIKPGVNKLFSNGSTSITVTKDEVNTTQDCSTPVIHPNFTLEGVCDINNDRVSVSDTADYTAGSPIWHDSLVSVTFTMHDGVNKVFENGERSFTITKQEVNTSDCPVQKVSVTAVDGSFTDECGPEYNLVFTPTVTEGVRYVQHRNGNTLTVTAEVTDSSKYTLKNASWMQEQTDHLVACEEQQMPPKEVFNPTTCLNQTASIKVDYDQTKYAYTVQLKGTSLETVLESGKAFEITATATPQSYIVRAYTLAGYEAKAAAIYTSDDLVVTLANGCGGVTETPTTPEPPVTPSVPAAPSSPSTPVVSAGKGAVMPTELPETGASFNVLLVGTLAAAVAYGALYFAQPKRFYE